MISIHDFSLERYIIISIYSLSRKLFEEESRIIGTYFPNPIHFHNASIYNNYSFLKQEIQEELTREN
jgi:hypothetical protein